MDNFDRRILEALQANNLTPAERLAETVGLSPSAVQRRVNRLRASGVIAADVSIVDPAVAGRPMTFIVEVSLERESAEAFEAFRRAMRAAPEVQQCYYVTGEGDFVLIITARDMNDYEQLTRRLFIEDSSIRRFRTSVVMRRVKASLAVPIEEDAE
jgi:Lrp/AsnC family leucine-responsive transcriptional regulator